MSEQPETLHDQPVPMHKAPREIGFPGKVVIVLGSVLVLFAVVFGSFALNSYLRELKIKKNQEAIRQMVLFCEFNELSSEEQRNLNDAGTDVHKAEAVLSNILNDRVIYWDKRMTEVNRRLEKVQDVRSTAGFWNAELQRIYTATVDKIIADGDPILQQLQTWRDKRTAFQNREYVNFDPRKSRVPPAPLGNKPV